MTVKRKTKDHNCLLLIEILIAIIFVLRCFGECREYVLDATNLTCCAS